MSSTKCQNVGDKMFKNKGVNANNICGKRIAMLRKGLKPKTSQRALAEKLQLIGLDVDKNAIQRIESGQRFITDIELTYFAKVFKVSVAELFD